MTTESNTACVPAKSPHPFWSVMIPTYNPRFDYLEQALRSVLDQDPGPEAMQIEVVDDASPDVDVEEMVRAIGGGRVSYFRSPANLGLAGCWNLCIVRSKGQWIHLLHQDDYVLPGFYERLARAAASHPEVSLLAARSFFVDAESIIFGVTPRLLSLENGGRIAEDFFYATPIQCPGVVVKMGAYETLGGFRQDLSFALDCEMWSRIISGAGGLVTPEILSCYRKSGMNETSRLARTAEGLRDIERLNGIFAGRYPEFDRGKALLEVCRMALRQTRMFSEQGDVEAARANLEFWNRHATRTQRARRFVVRCLRAVFG